MLIILIALILLNALFAMSEMALANVRKARLQKHLDNGDKGAIAALKLSENPSDYLSTIQIGITVITLINGVIGERVFAQPIENLLLQLGVVTSIAVPVGFLIAFSIVTYFSIVIGELVPKRLGQISPEFIARHVSRPIQLLSIITHPIVILLSASTHLFLRILRIKNTDAPLLTPEEIQAMIAEGSQTGLIDEQEHQMVKNVFRLDLRSIGSLMVPRADLVWLSVNDPIEDSIQTLENCPYTRFPVCKETINDVIGIITAKKFLMHALKTNQNAGVLNIENLVSPPLYVPESLNAMELLNELREAKSEMALVVDEYGDIQGIVTMQDLLEAITGQFDSTETGEAYAIVREDGSWLLDGLISNHELKDCLGIKLLPEEEKNTYNTLSGLMMFLLGRIPKTGDKSDWDGWRFEIVDMDGMRIDKVLATLIEDLPFEKIDV